MRWITTLVLLLSLSTGASGQALRSDPFNPVPAVPWDRDGPGQVRTWMRYENASIWGDIFTPFVKSGGLHGVISSLTSPAFATVAYTPQRVSQSATAIPYAAATNDYCWAIVSSQTGAITNWTQVGSSAYFSRCQGSQGGGAQQPPLPANSLWLMQVTITGNQIVAVLDISNRNPIPAIVSADLSIVSSTIAALPAAGTTGHLRRVSDGAVQGALVVDDGTNWTCQEAKSLRLIVPTCPPYNAKADGVTDDAAAINTAIGATPAGRTLYLNDGNYLVRSPILLNKSITLRCASWTGTKLIANTNIDIIQIDGQGADLFDVGVENCLIKTTLATPTSASRGIHILTGFRLFHPRILHNFFVNTYYGLFDDSQVTNDQRVWMHIQGNMFGAVVGDSELPAGGVQTVQYSLWRGPSGGGTGWVIEDNQFHTTTGAVGVTAEHIHVEGPSIGDTVIVGNHFEGGNRSVSLTCLAPFTYCSNFVVVGNKMDSVTLAIRTRSVANSTFLGNRAAGAAPDIDIISSNIFEISTASGYIPSSFAWRGDYLQLRDTSAAFLVNLQASSTTALTADRTLIFDVGNTTHSLRFGAAVSDLAFPTGTKSIPALQDVNTWTGSNNTFNTVTAGTVNASNYQKDSVPGLSQTFTMCKTGACVTTCTIITSSGLVTGGTC